MRKLIVTPQRANIFKEKTTQMQQKNNFCKKWENAVEIKYLYNNNHIICNYFPNKNRNIFIISPTMLEIH